MSKAVIEHGLRLSIHRLVTAGANNKGCHVLPSQWASAWQWTRDGKPYFAARYSIEQISQSFATLTLSYKLDNEPIDYSMRLTALPCRFGGQRWFALCPRTGRMVSKIYLPIGAKRFLSRHAYRLAYRSQRDAAGFSRACNQRDRIASAKLKSDDLAFPLKPKWMRWKTFDRYMARHMALNQAMDAATIQRFGLSNFIM